MSNSDSIRSHHIKFTLELAATPEHAWRWLTESIDAWWPADFRAGPAGSRMQLTARLGGHLFEADELGNGIVWYQVIALQAPTSVQLAGFIAPPFGGPATSLLRLQIIRGTGKHCALEVQDSVLGVVDGAAVESGWRAIFGRFAESLKP
jgi:hypothetical protein